MQQTITINYEEFDSFNELSPTDKELLTEAFAATNLAYAPYSNFKVGAAAKLTDNSIITAANQENSTYGATICAERALLVNPTINSNNTIETIAVSYINARGESNHPISCCGICRQVLLEYEQRISKPIRLILGGKTGKILIFNNLSSLLPLGFSKKSM